MASPLPGGRRTRRQGRAGVDETAPDDRDAADHVLKGMGAHEITERCSDRGCELVTWPKDDDADVRTRRVPTDVTEPSVERDQQSHFTSGTRITSSSAAPAMASSATVSTS